MSDIKEELKQLKIQRKNIDKQIELLSKEEHRIKLNQYIGACYDDGEYNNNTYYKILAVNSEDDVDVISLCLDDDNAVLIKTEALYLNYFSHMNYIENECFNERYKSVIDKINELIK